ncbi:MAG: arginine repressor [Myxococcaceae bacterium]
MDAELAQRRGAIRSLLRTQRVGTQEELGELLAKKGFEVTQATLSRDLAKLKARRVTLPEGGSVYELEELPTAPVDEALGPVKQLVLGVDHNETMVVVTTTPGAASVVAQGIDRARLNSVLGSIAGDDTIFVAPTRKSSAAGLAKQLQSLWRRAER